jgi:anti-anti-sigma factor
MCSLFVEHDGGHTIVAVAGAMDLGSAPRVAETLDLLDGPLVIDCSDLDFIDTSGLHVLVNAVATHGSVTLRRASPFVVDVVEILGLDRVLEIETRGATARAS